MAVNNTQYLSFLGGLVSPRLWLRSDMDKFGKWFATADNIRFHTVGSFENRFGTIKVGNTYRNTAGENIKLIKFDFGQGETCMLELGSGYFRVITKDGFIMDDVDPTAPKVFNSPIILSDSDDVKYVQSGDIIFLTNQNGIYEIKRLTKDFTSWKVSAFSFIDNIVPYGDENDDDNKTLSASSTSISQQGVFSVYLPESAYDENYIYNPSVNIVINSVNTNVYNVTSGYILKTVFITDLNSALSQYNITATLSGNLLSFDTSNATDTIGTINVSCKYCAQILTSQEYNSRDYFIYNSQSTFMLYSIYISLGHGYPDVEYKVDSPYITGISANISKFNDKYAPAGGTQVARLVSNSQGTGFTLQVYVMPDGSWVYGPFYVKYFDSDNLFSFSENAEYQGQSTGGYTITSFGGFFSNKQNGETFMIRHIINAGYIHFGNGQYTSTESSAGSVAPLSIKSNGFWRYNSSGLWTGKVELQYSTDNGTTWITFFTRKNTTHEQYSTTNDNTSGRINTDGITVLLRMVCNITGEDNDAKFSAELAVDKFEVNSVYKIYNITGNNTAVVECVKGDIGEFVNNSHWREAEFSYAKGYPTAIGFYQNRLFLGKEYKLYSSRINDFWDFYESIEVADDDPMTMSLLSYKVNNIQNLIGIRSFFVFTSGGEFGIGAEGGALTQATKYLKQISAHGSNSCNPIFCGDIIVFVDKTNNTVRAFRYSLESDGWEATDVSVLIEQVLEGKKIITTEYMQDTKECLFLTDEGEVYVFKFFQEQNIAAWSVWKHAKYKITNLCVLEDELGKDILYIAVNTDTGMQIEQFNPNYYCDSVETFSNETEFDSVTTTFQENDKVVVNDGTDLYLAEVGEDGVVSLRNTTSYATVGLSYTSIATLLSPEIQDRDGTFSTFNRKRPFKVFAFHRNSYGFKVGVEEENKQEPQWQPIWSTADEETALTTGKTSVLIPARYNGSSRVSFVQDKPYPMIIENVLLETDYGGK